jgi:inosine/xanthosine triphosphatase
VLVLVGSHNPIKVGAVQDVFDAYFPDVRAEGLEVESGVPAQPVGDDTFVGAHNRALALVRRDKVENLGASYFVGLEGGIAQLNGRWLAFGAACVVDAKGRCGFGVSPMFELPAAITAALLAGEELGHVVDRLSGDHNTKQKGGAIAFFTQGRVDRRQLYAQGMTMALVPFLNEAMYFRGDDPG